MMWIEWDSAEYRPQEAKGVRTRVIESGARLNMRDGVAAKCRMC